MVDVKKKKKFKGIWKKSFKKWNEKNKYQYIFLKNGYGKKITKDMKKTHMKKSTWKNIYIYNHNMKRNV